MLLGGQDWCINYIIPLWTILFLLLNLFMARLQHRWQIVGVTFGFMYSLNAHLLCGEMNGVWPSFSHFNVFWGLEFSLEEISSEKYEKEIISAIPRDPSVLSLYVPDGRAKSFPPSRLSRAQISNLLSRTVFGFRYTVIKIFNMTDTFLWNCSWIYHFMTVLYKYL